MKAATAILKELTPRQAGHLSSLWFLLSAGGILALIGVSNALDVLGKSQIWDLPAPLLGIPFRYLLPLVGLAELLFVAWLCLSTNGHYLSLGLIGGMVSIFIVSRVVLWTMGWYHPGVFVGDLAAMLNISPLFADIILADISAFLLVGSGLAFLEISKAAADLDLLQIYRPASAAILSLPHKTSEKRFPAHALGQKIQCPIPQKVSRC